MVVSAKAHPVSIGAVVALATLFNPRSRSRAAMDPESLAQQVTDLFALLAERGIDYLLVGGIAVLQYVEGRNTEDIDLILSLTALDRIPEIEILERDEDFVRGSFRGLQVDLLLTSNPLFEQARRSHATVQTFVERAIPCATVEGLLVLKLYALPSLYRQGNFARVGLYENDIATLLQAYRTPLEPLFEELAPHLSATDLRELRGIVAEIERRIERFEQAGSAGSPPVS
jgi:hypothetical protein